MNRFQFENLLDYVTIFMMEIVKGVQAVWL